MIGTMRIMSLFLSITRVHIGIRLKVDSTLTENVVHRFAVMGILSNILMIFIDLSQKSYGYHHYSVDIKP